MTIPFRKSANPDPVDAGLEDLLSTPVHPKDPVRDAKTASLPRNSQRIPKSEAATQAEQALVQRGQLYSGLADWRFFLTVLIVTFVQQVVIVRGSPLIQLIWLGLTSTITSGSFIYAIRSRQDPWLKWTAQSGTAIALASFLAQLLLIGIGISNV